MEQELAKKLANAGNNREKLIALMNELDEEKRCIRNSLRKFSNESYGEGGLAGKKRFQKIRRMKAKLSHLIEDREFIRQKIGQVNADQKTLNRITNEKRPQYCHAFVAATERLLSEEQFIEIELKALDILDGHS